MSKKRVTHFASYEPPVTPASWGADARMFAQRVKRLFDELFARQIKASQSIADLADANEEVAKQLNDSVESLPDSIFRAVVDSIYKVGDLFETTVAENDPNKKWTWQKWEPYMPGRVLIGAGVSDYGVTHSAGQTGGEASHTLSVSEMPKHQHVFHRQQWYTADTVSADNIYSIYSWKQESGGTTSASYIGSDSQYDPVGGSQPHNNMQPYAVVYRWIRVE